MDRKGFWFLPVLVGLILSLASCASTAPTASTVPTVPSTASVTTYVPPGAESLCESAFSSPVTSGSVSTPIRTLVYKDYEGKQWDWDPNTMLVPHVEPIEPTSQINTLLCIRESRVQEITYSDGEAGYRIVWDARLVLYPSGEVVGAQKFEGEPPPTAETWETMKAYMAPPWYGNRPEGSLLQWLFSSLGDETVFCHGLGVYTVAFSPDGELLAACGDGNIARIWDVARREEARSLTVGEDLLYVGALAFSPDGKTLALPGESLYPETEPVRLWDVATGEERLAFSSDEYLDVHGLAFSPDGRMVASGNGDGAVHLWDAATGEILKTLSAHTDLVSGVVFSPDGKLLASGSYDGTVVLWDVAAGQALLTLNAHTDFVNGVAFSPDGKILASGSSDRTVILWDVATGQPLNTFSGDDSVTSVAFSPDGTMVASGEVNHVKLWDVATGEVLRVLQGHAKSVTSLGFSPAGKMLASGSIDTTVRLWDVATGQ